MSTERQIEAAVAVLKKCQFRVTVSDVRAALAAAEAAAWEPIESAPKDRPFLAFAPGRDGLPDLISACQWHEDAGFCICELREPTYWRPLPSPPGQEGG